MNLSTTLPALGSTEWFNINKINLNNYYKNKSSSLIIHCEICKIDVRKADIFEHTISKRHKYNKLFIGIVQGSYLNEDLDFIVMNIDKLKCRHCNFGTINSGRNDDIISHIKTTEHKIRIANYFTKINMNNERDSTSNSKSLKPLDILITVKQKHKNVAQYSVPHGLRETRKDNELPKFIIVTEDSMCICTVCIKQIPYTSFNINQHITGKAHNIMLQKSGGSSVSQEQKIETPKQELPKPVVARPNSIYTCTTCRMQIPNTAYDIQMHNLNRTHRMNIQSSQAAVQSTSYPRVAVSYERPVTSYRPITHEARRSECNIL